MARFDVNQGTFFPCVRLVAALVGAANPGTGRVSAMLIMQFTFQNEDFLTAKMAVFIEPGVRRPTHQCNVFRTAPAGELMQWHNLQAIDQAWQPFSRTGTDNFLFSVVLIELVQLYEYERTFRTHPRAMAGSNRITNIGSGRVRAMFIGKLSFQNKDFFSATVAMLRKFTVGIVTDQRCCTSDFVTQAVKHHAGNTRYRRGPPLVI